MSKKRIPTAKIRAPKQFPLTGDQLLPPIDQLIRIATPRLKSTPPLNEGSIHVVLMWDSGINQVLDRSFAVPDGQMGGYLMKREELSHLVSQLDSALGEKMREEPKCTHPFVLFAVRGEMKYMCTVCDLGVVGPS